MTINPICTSGDWRPGSLEQRNSTLAAILSNALHAAFNGNLTNNEVLIYCAVQPGVCQGICPNADVTGVGVRVAFYLNAILTALLVGLSPQDSPSAAWSSTILTMSLVIPAIIQKEQEMLTLYHATLVLNFATFSSVSSLAVVPLCTIWRHIDNTDHPLYNATQNLPVVQSPPSEAADAWSVSTTTKPQRRRARIVLSFALIAQVSLQWVWAIYLFISPYYAQKACNPFTVVVLFGVSKTASEINRGLFGLWASWLLFSILVTLLFGVLLVNSCTSGVNTMVQSRKQLRPPKRSWLKERIRSWDKNGDKRRLIIFVIAFVICLLLVAFSEKQVKQNCVFDENTQWGFGQVSAWYLGDVVWLIDIGQLTAMLVALAPLWNILESERGQHLGQMLFAILSRKDVIRIEDRVEDGADVLRDHNRHPSSNTPLLLDRNSFSDSLKKSDLGLQDLSYQMPSFDSTPLIIDIDASPTLGWPGSEADSNYGHSIATVVDEVEVPTITIVPPTNESSLDL